MPRFFCITLIMLSGLLVACQTPPTTQKNTPVSSDSSLDWSSQANFFLERQQWASDFVDWKLLAKVGVSAPNVNESVNLVWWVSGDTSTLRMFGPLGLGSVRIDLSQSGATLTDGKGKQYYSEDAESLLLNVTGWAIPINALQYWVLALPAPQSVFEFQSDKEGLMTALKQLGWRIQYSKYTMPAKQMPPLPRKISAIKTVTIDGLEKPLKVRLIVKSVSASKS